MPINFFDKPCKTSSNAKRFGLCDDPPPSENSAYIDENDDSKWIGIVNNPTNKEVDFYAIDNCVDVLRADGNKESRCDGMLNYEKNIIFVELKMRGTSGWLTKARNQLTITISKFQEENNLSQFNAVEAYACNGLRPLSNLGNSAQIQKFKDETGLIMYAQQEINI
jgi:hypothetical protein